MSFLIATRYNTVWCSEEHLPYPLVVNYSTWNQKWKRHIACIITIYIYFASLLFMFRLGRPEQNCILSRWIRKKDGRYLNIREGRRWWSFSFLFLFYMLHKKCSFWSKVVNIIFLSCHLPQIFLKGSWYNLRKNQLYQAGSLNWWPCRDFLEHSVEQ